ncbi:MAG TPA: PfkB family carbohydrate kinase [Micromonosporaceae bacterium]|nr:PfkB family carbohydrate kinase [Micromonosporaceae bacterium]
MVIGQITRDLVLTVDQVPGPAGTTAVRQRREMLGGKGANQAVGLAQLGVSVGLLGVVGDDEVGRRVLDQARSDGIDTSPVVCRPGTETALVVDIVDRQGQWHYLESMPAGTLLTEPDVAATPALDGASAALVQLQQPTAAALAAARRAHAAGARVLLDGAPEEARQRDALLAVADIVRADAREAEKLTGASVTDPASAVRVGRDLLGRGPSMVALAVGTRGNAFIWRDGQALIPLVDTPVADTTGAGDALIAGLVAALLRGEEPRQAARFAVAAAAATVGHPGGRPNLSADGIDEQLAKVHES